MAASVIKLLYVEDSRIEQTVFKHTIRKLRLPYECVIVGSVAGAKKALNETDFDVVLTDYFLEDGTAFDFFGEVSDTPVIVITAAQDHRIAIQALKAGAFDYLLKIPDANHFEALPVTVERAVRQKRAERQSRMLSHAVMSISDSIYICDAEDRIIFVNAAFCRTYGYNEREIIGECSVVLTTAELGSQAPSKIPFSVDGLTIYNRRKGGEQFAVSLNRSVVRDEMGEIKNVVGVVRDMTELKSLETERERLWEQLRQSQKLEALGILAGGIAHDFNNMLGSIIGFTELSASDVTKESIIAANLREVLKASFRARDLVEQILIFSRHTIKEDRPIALDQIAREVVKQVEPKVPPGVKVELNLGEESQWILADSSKIHQMLMNFLMNAFHATSENRGTVTISIERLLSDTEISGVDRSVPPGDYVHLRVADTGYGMSPDVSARIFEPFFTTKRVGEGTGLGLSIIHGVVADHGGVISVSSEPGVGTVFDVYLPSAAAAVVAQPTTAELENSLSKA